MCVRACVCMCVCVCACVVDRVLSFGWKFTCPSPLFLLGQLVCSISHDAQREKISVDRAEWTKERDDLFNTYQEDVERLKNTFQVL